MQWLQKPAKSFKNSATPNSPNFLRICVGWQNWWTTLKTSLLTCTESPCRQSMGRSTTWASMPGRMDGFVMLVSPKHVVLTILASRGRLWRKTWKWQSPSITSKSQVRTDSASAIVNITYNWYKMNIWMNEWMNEQMNEWANEWINEWTNDWKNEWMNE